MVEHEPSSFDDDDGDDDDDDDINQLYCMSLDSVY